jgi:hypothetical protein
MVCGDYSAVDFRDGAYYVSYSPYHRTTTHLTEIL